MTGPCLCGDPYCGSCGDPGAAALEEFVESLMETMKDYSIPECEIFVEGGKKAVREARTWVTFTRRTNDPKLAWLERQLDLGEIAHRRQGESFHAPILEVHNHQLYAAGKILEPIDDIPDDDERYQYFWENEQ